MRKLDEATINVFRNLKQYLPARDFRKNIELQLPDYEVSVEFLKEFNDDLNMGFISKQSLNPDCIHYLINNDQFQYNLWLENVKDKNIDILVDDDFVSRYGVDCNTILAESRNITSAIYSKFINNCSDEAAKNLLLRYNGPEVSIETIASKFYLLGMDAFKIQLVKDDLKNENSVFEKMVLSSGRDMNIFMLLALMVYCYDPKTIREHLDDLVFYDIVLDETNPNANEEMNKAQSMLIQIFERYPMDIVGEIFKDVYYYAKNTLLSRELLYRFMITCSDISEDCLMTIFDVFILTGLRDELVNYCKNHQYTSVLLALKLA